MSCLCVVMTVARAGVRLVMRRASDIRRGTPSAGPPPAKSKSNSDEGGGDAILLHALLIERLARARGRVVDRTDS